MHPAILFLFFEFLVPQDLPSLLAFFNNWFQNCLNAATYLLKEDSQQEKEALPKRFLIRNFARFNLSVQLIFSQYRFYCLRNYRRFSTLVSIYMPSVRLIIILISCRRSSPGSGIVVPVLAIRLIASRACPQSKDEQRFVLGRQRACCM